jgi:5-methylcytosine-specific restriction endonuclease McrA
MFTAAARAVEPETYQTHAFETWTELSVAPDEPCVRTVRLSIKVPEIVVLTRHRARPRSSVVFNRRNLFARDRNTCQYCGARPGTAELTIDHVLPRSRGGQGSWENCVLACVRCNLKKRNRTPEEAGMKMLHAPHKPAWSPIIDVPIARVRQSWRRFVSEAYWNVPLVP